MNMVLGALMYATYFALFVQFALERFVYRKKVGKKLKTKKKQ
jgi:hypothetical protein